MPRCTCASRRQTLAAFPVSFESRVGNNARFAFDWRNVDPFRDCTTARRCAVTPTRRRHVRPDPLEYYITVNGGEYRPEPGAAFGGTFIDYPNDAWRTANCN